MPDELATDFTPFAITPVWLLRHETLPSDAKALYGILMSYADNTTHVAFPSRETLAKCLSGKTTKSVDRAVKALADVGAITVTRRWRNKRGQTSTSKTADFSEPTSTLYKLHQQPVRGSDTGVPTLETQVSVRSDTGVPLTTPSDLDPSELDVNYSTGKPASVKSHTQPPLMQPVQGKSKEALDTGGEPVPLPRDLRHRNGDTASDRVIRWVGYAQGMTTRGQAVAWLSWDTPAGVSLDAGQWDGSEWVGALRRLVVGFDGVARCDDRELRRLIDYARSQPDGLEWLVTCTQDGLSAPLSA